MSHGKHKKRRRGCHKRHTSPEIKRWFREDAIPERPSWMAPQTYHALARLRLEL